MGDDDHSSTEMEGTGSELPARRRILFSLRQLARALDIHSRRLASDKQVTSAQLFALKMLSRDDVDTASTVAGKMHLSASTVVGILDRLEEKDLITRSRDREDRRVVRVTLTPRGRDLIRETPHPVEDLLRRKTDGGLSDSEADWIADALEMLVEALGAGTVEAEKPLGELPHSDTMPGGHY